MRFLNLYSYSLLSFVATLIAIVYSTQQSLFHTPKSPLNLGALLEPLIKEVFPFTENWPATATLEERIACLFISEDWDQCMAARSPAANTPHSASSDKKRNFVPSSTVTSPGTATKEAAGCNDSDKLNTKSNGQHSFLRTPKSSRWPTEDHFEQFRLLEGAAGVKTGFKPSAFQSMLAERYLRFRTPSPAVLLHLQVILSYLQNEKLCVLVFTNMAFCLSFLAARLFVKTFFGDLRTIERQHMYDRALNFLLFKLVFVGAILEPRWEELLIWVAWFTILGFLRVFSMLCRDRIEYLTVTPNILRRVHIKIYTMLILILISNLTWFVMCISVFRSMLLLLSFECFTLFLDTIQTLVKYTIHLIETARGGEPCESRRKFQYYTEFITDTMILVTTLGHYVHIMYLHGISFTLIDAVLFLNMRSVFNDLRKKLASHQAYRRAFKNIEARFPTATEKQLSDYSDDCAICRDTMTTAKVLPCGHIFHLFCIRSWLEHHSSCPTCRRMINSENETKPSNNLQQRRESITERATTSGRSLPLDDHDDSNMSSNLSSSSLSSGTGLTQQPPAMVGLSNSSISAGPSTRSSSQSGGHQLFAFNSEHQPWMSRLGFPRIRVEVTDPPSTDEGDMEEEMRRAIRESLGLNLSSSSLSSHSIGSSPVMSPSPGRSGASTPLGPFTPMYAASSSALATGLHGQSDSMFLRRGSACSASASNFDYERAKEV